MKIDQFMMLPMMSVGLASTTFTGQNVGASYIDRAQKGATTAFLLAELVTIVMMITLLIFAPQMVYLFKQEAAVIRYGTLFLYLLSPFYILCCVNQVYSNVLRGAGDTRTPTVSYTHLDVYKRQSIPAVTKKVGNDRRSGKFFRDLLYNLDL